MKKGCKKKKGVKHEVWSAQSVSLLMRLNLDQTVTSNFSQTTIKTMVMMITESPSSVLAFNSQQSLTQIPNDSLSSLPSLPTFLTFK